MKTLQQKTQLYSSALDFQFDIRDRIIHGEKEQWRKIVMRELQDQLIDSCAYCLKLRDDIENEKKKISTGQKIKAERKKYLMKVIADAKAELKAMK